MEYTMTLPENHPPMPLRDLLEREWLVPPKKRPFLRHTYRYKPKYQVEAWRKSSETKKHD